ncbi:hypothetical protein BDZ97DRAFT_1918803 [Flammula alnicola]|nr:hypothetical protein BDZ97DRAFT_1925923 [Flammula alnicola]KAF8964616.1 hypothetical protein BDZ97DRAFT_1918803 [Flammula alnicola]
MLPHKQQIRVLGWEGGSPESEESLPDSPRFNGKIYVVIAKQEPKPPPPSTELGPPSTAHDASSESRRHRPWDDQGPRHLRNVAAAKRKHITSSPKFRPLLAERPIGGLLWDFGRELLPHLLNHRTNRNSGSINGPTLGTCLVGAANTSHLRLTQQGRSAAPAILPAFLLGLFIFKFDIFRPQSISQHANVSPPHPVNPRHVTPRPNFPSPGRWFA